MAHRQLRRELKLLRVWAGFSGLCFLVFAFAAFRSAQPAPARNPATPASWSTQLKDQPAAGSVSTPSAPPTRVR